MIVAYAPIPGDEAREAADDILSRAEYVQEQPSLVERVLEAIVSRIAQGLSGLAGGGPGGVLTLLVVAAVVGGGLYLLVRSGVIGWTPRPSTDHGPAVAHDRDEPDDPDLWRRAATEAEARGDLRGALRARYRVLVATVERTDLLDRRPGRTPREFVGDLAPAVPERRDELDRLTERFEVTWYGGAPVDQATYDRFRLDVDAVVRDVTRRPRVAVGAGSPA